MKERGDTELSATILGRHLAVYKLLRNSYLALNHFPRNSQSGGRVYLAL